MSLQPSASISRTLFNLPITLSAYNDSIEQEIGVKRPAPENEHRGAIGRIVVDAAVKYLVTSGIEDKRIKVWLLEDLSRLSFIQRRTGLIVI